MQATRRQPLFTMSADRGWEQRFRYGEAGDVPVEGFVLWRLSWALPGWQISGLRYRAPFWDRFWLTLSTAVMIGLGWGF